MLVTHENYRSPEANQFYMSYSQYTDFQRCEARALAIIRGEYEEEVTTAMLQGGYVDAYVAGTLDQFKMCIRDRRGRQPLARAALFYAHLHHFCTI